MFTVLFISSFLALFIGLSFVLSGWWMILWFIAAYLFAVFMLWFGIYIHALFTYKVSYLSRYKNYGWRSASVAIGVFMFNVTVKIVGAEKIPQDGKLVVYSNHKSYLDPMIVMQSIKRPSAFTPKSSLYKIPFFSTVLKVMGCMPVYRGDDRKTAKALVEAIKKVEQGFVMCVFPEGGRKDRDTDEVKATRAGAFKMAVKPQATILPVTINGNSQIQHNAPFRRTKITVVVHDPIPYETYKNLQTSEIGDLVMGAINSGLIEK